MQHDSLIKMESAASTAGGQGTSSAMSPPSASSVGGNYFNLNSLIATPTSNSGAHNVQSTSPISSSIILATSAQNHHGIHGNLLFDSMAGGGGNTCPSSPTLLTPSSTHHLTHLTTPDHHTHNHYLHYHHSFHHMSPHHAHLAMPPQGSLIMSSAPGSQSPGASGALMLHGEGQFQQQQQQSYMSAKMESPGSMDNLNQEHRLQEVGGAGQGQGQQGASMMLGNSYSM